jgi:hypothetical protein
MPRRIGYSLMFGAAAVSLVWAGWPASANLATLIRRVDVIAAVLILAGLPWLARKIVGPAGASRPARAVRGGGYAVVFSLMLVKAATDRFEYATAGRARLPGALAGEIIFLGIVAAYVAGLLAVTARRPRFSPAALTIGTGAGLAAGLIMYTLPPLGSPLHLTSAWPARVYGAARILAVPLALGVVVAAGLMAARRASGRGSKLLVADVRARQGVAAGLCAGAAAALLLSVLDIGTIALAPRELTRLQWALSSPHLAAGSVYGFEMSVSAVAAGHLLVLAFFPLLGAGLGAWGGLCAAGRPGQLPGGNGGGGGHRPPEPTPPLPEGGRHLGDERRPVILRGGYLVELPVREGASRAPADERAAPADPDTIPAG